MKVQITTVLFIMEDILGKSIPALAGQNSPSLFSSTHPPAGGLRAPCLTGRQAVFTNERINENPGGSIPVGTPSASNARLGFTLAAGQS
ncbi:MAG: hypothetical protein V3U24_08845 [Candidatus Neomarinimicrobiota bacterium]